MDVALRVSAMVLKRSGHTISTENITKEVVALDGYIESVGWRHASLVRFLCNKGLPSYTQEFTLPNNDLSLFDFGIEKMTSALNNNTLVIASVF